MGYLDVDGAPVRRAEGLETGVGTPPAGCQSTSPCRRDRPAGPPAAPAPDRDHRHLTMI
jgi:hypothetical protein